MATKNDFSVLPLVYIFMEMDGGEREKKCRELVSEFKKNIMHESVFQPVVGFINNFFRKISHFWE